MLNDHVDNIGCQQGQQPDRAMLNDKDTRSNKQMQPVGFKKKPERPQRGFALVVVFEQLLVGQSG